MNRYELDFTEKIILITGATRGIGKEIAIRFSKLGAQIIVHGRRADAVKQLAEEINSDFVVCDLSSEQDINTMIDTISQKYKSLHILINNAGMEIEKPYEEFSMEEFDLIFNVNTRSIFQLTKGLFPLLKNAGNSSVINMSSTHQTYPYPTNTPYCMAKAAMEMFSKVVAMEWAPYNIRVNTLAPGAILTDMNREVIESYGMGKFSAFIANGRIGNVEDVFNACCFLGSDMSSYMTGDTLFIDGGLRQGLLPYGKTPAMQKMIDELKEKDNK